MIRWSALAPVDRPVALLRVCAEIFSAVQIPSIFLMLPNFMYLSFLPSRTHALDCSGISFDLLIHTWVLM